MAYTPPINVATTTAPRGRDVLNPEAIKKESISRCCALNNATATVTAYATLLAATKGMENLREDEVRNWIIALKHSELKENYKLLGVEETIEF